MPVVHVIDTLTDWAWREICTQIKLKQPPENTEPTDSEYEYKLVNPQAFPLYAPTSEKLPPNVHSPFPSVCVRFVTGADDLTDNERAVDVQLCFSAWDPGIHSQDIFNPAGDGSFSRQGAGETEFERTADGWRDAWNFVDIALREIESVSFIGDYTIDRNTAIKYGPLTEQEAIPNLYPFWFAWISFRVNCPLMRNNDYNDLL